MKKQPMDGKRLLQLHHLHLGLYARVAKQLDLSPGYVSRAANGTRKNEKATETLLRELQKLSKM